MTAVVETLHLPDPPECEFPASGITMHWHRPAPAASAARAGAGVVVLPIQGGDYDVSTMLASWLAKIGYSAVRFERRAEWLDPDRNLNEIAALTQAWIRDISAGLDAWLTQPDAPDAARLGLLGVSMGAMIGTSVLARDERFAAGVLVIGGADTAGVLQTARDKEVNEYRRDLSRRLKIDEADIGALMRRELGPGGPEHDAPGVDTDSTLMIAARFDRVVRWRYSCQLWEALGRPQRRTLPCGHYSTVVFLPLVKRWIRRWFDKQLG